jgi:hypothetical protein
LAALLLAGAAYVWTAVRKRGQPLLDRWTAACLFVPVAVFGLGAAGGATNVGIRHLLPIYPLVIIAVAVAAARGWRRSPRVWKLVVPIIALLAACETAVAFPDYISFFNIAARSWRDPRRLLGDSNLDWGQGLKALAEWEREHAHERIALHYFGEADPAYYLAHYEPLKLERDGALGPGRGELRWPAGPSVLAISATHLQGIYLPKEARALYRPLLSQRPLAVLRGSIYLFENPARDQHAPSATRPSR